MQANYIPETLQLLIVPETDDERRMVMSLLSVLVRGGIVKTKPNQRKQLETKFTRTSIEDRSGKVCGESNR